MSSPGELAVGKTVVAVHEDEVLDSVRPRMSLAIELLDAQEPRRAIKEEALVAARREPVAHRRHRVVAVIVVGLDQQPGPAMGERLLATLEDRELMALDVNLDEADRREAEVGVRER